MTKNSKLEKIAQLRGKNDKPKSIGLVRIAEGEIIMLDPTVINARFAIQQNPWAFLRLYKEMGKAIREYKNEVTKADQLKLL